MPLPENVNCFALYVRGTVGLAKPVMPSVFFQEDEDEEAEVPSETEAGEEDEVDVCAVERIPALCSRYTILSLKPFSPNSDHHLISPCIVTTSLSMKFKRINDMITKDGMP